MTGSYLIHGNSVEEINRVMKTISSDVSRAHGKLTVIQQNQSTQEPSIASLAVTPSPSSITLSGDVTGSGSSSIATSLSTTQGAAITWNSLQTFSNSATSIFVLGGNTSNYAVEFIGNTYTSGTNNILLAGQSGVSNGFTVQYSSANGMIYIMAAGSLTVGGQVTATLFNGPATSLAGGGAGYMAYQLAANTTTFVAPGTNGYVWTMVAGVPAWAAASGGGGTGRLINIQTFTSSGTYTKATNNPSFVVVEMVGGGGGGGGSTSYTWSGGTGGFAGGYSRMKILNASLLASETITIGAGGSSGGAGGTSSFGSHFSATGGSVSAAGNGVGGDLNLKGGAGGPGVSDGSAFAVGGNGGASFFGGGGLAGVGAGGAAGANTGAGGAGGACQDTATAGAGGAGGTGLVIVYEYS
jgi:hypothetical protein